MKNLLRNHEDFNGDEFDDFCLIGELWDNGDYYEDLNMRISRNICLGNDRRFYLIDEWEDNENID